MRIGIDLDDTIFDTTQRYEKLQYTYLLKKNITKEELWKNKENRFDFIKTYFDDIFLKLEVKKDVIDTLKLLKKLGHEIYIVTARSKRYNKDIYKVTKNSLIKNNILFDKLVLTEKEKLSACLENNIDMMIDNSIDIYNELNSNNIKFLLFDEDKKYLNIKNRVSSWNEISKLFRRDEK